MTRHRDFLIQLENFRHETYAAAQFLYSDMAVQHAGSKSPKLLARLNLTPRFWLAHAASSQTAAYISLGRIFDTTSKFNLGALLDCFEANLHLFAREALEERKREGRAEDPQWLAEYLAKAHYPTIKDVTRLRKRVEDYRAIYDKAVRRVRNKYLAHREKEDDADVQALYSSGKVRELWRLVTFLHALHIALREQYQNGRRPVIRLRRYSVKSIYDSKTDGNSPHESIVTETRKLMVFIENATPNAAFVRPLKSNAKY